MTIVDEAQLQHFWWFVTERQAIWQRRFVEQREAPWTTDSILRGNHFTNVYRELDPGTQFAQASLSQLSREDGITFTVAYRMLNRRQTVEAYGLLPTRDTVDQWLEFITDRFAAKKPVMSRRHLTPSRALYERGVRASCTLDVPTAPVDAMRAIRTVPGAGRFLGWQILCDLVEAGHVEDDPDYVVVGDGAGFATAVLAGSSTFSVYLHDGSIGRRVVAIDEHRGRIRPSDGTNEAFAQWVRYVRDVQDWHLVDFPHWNGQRLSLKNIEHSLCEWTRYGVIAAKAAAA